MTTQNINDIETKQIRDFKVNFKQTLDKTGDYIKLEVEYNQTIRDLLQGIIVINETENTEIRNGYINGEYTQFKFKRYLVKRVFFSCLSNDYKECLFSYDLINKGKFVFKFESLNYLEQFKINFKDSLKKIIELAIENINITQTISYRVNN